MSSRAAGAGWKCGNCRSRFDQDEVDAPTVGDPLCPDCGLNSMTEMSQVECDCGNTTFALDQPAGFSDAAPTARCTDCGETARLDEDGVWWG